MAWGRCLRRVQREGSNASSAPSIPETSTFEEVLNQAVEEKLAYIQSTSQEQLKVCIQTAIEAMHQTHWQRDTKDGEST